MSGIGEQLRRRAYAADGHARTAIARHFPMIVQIVRAELAWHLNQQNHAFSDPAIIAALTAELLDLGDLLKTSRGVGPQPTPRT